MNEYRKGPLITTSAGRRVWSFSAFLDECARETGDAGTHMRSLAAYEWDHGTKSVAAVVQRFREATRKPAQGPQA